MTQLASQTSEVAENPPKARVLSAPILGVRTLGARMLAARILKARVLKARVLATPILAAPISKTHQWISETDCGKGFPSLWATSQ